MPRFKTCSRGDVSWFLLVLFALKLLATSLTLGSGASGGIFSPALFMGATLGGVYGLAMHWLFPGLPIDPAAFAVAGMAGVVGGSTGAALAAIVMIFEMTLDYKVIIPMTITVALSYGMRKMLLRQSIYTLKLARRGHDIPDALQANFYHLKKTREVMDTHFVAVPADGTLDDFVRIATEQPEVSCFLVEGPEGFVGFLTRDSALRPSAQPEKPVTLADLADRRFVTVGEDTPLLDVMTRLRAAGRLRRPGDRRHGQVVRRRRPRVDHETTDCQCGDRRNGLVLGVRRYPKCRSIACAEKSSNSVTAMSHGTILSIAYDRLKPARVFSFIPRSKESRAQRWPGSDSEPPV